MRPRLLLLTCILALSSAPLLAQARPARDPLTGSWSGYIGQSEAQPAPAKFQFKLAADGSVTGSVTGPKIVPGDIKSGTFDRSTGALKLNVVLHGNNGEGGNVSVDGKVTGDSASGKMILGGTTGFFRLMRDAARSQPEVVKKDTRPEIVQANARPTADAALRRSFVEVSEWITRAAEMVPAEKYSYRPVSTVRTFGQIIGHVVDGSHFYCGRGAARNVQWSDATEKGVTDKAALVQALKQAFADCGATYDRGGGEVGPLVENVGHSSLHYGNLVTYLRMMGMTPPSS